MRDPGRIQRVLALLGQYWSRYPDLRLVQIVCNLFGELGDPYYWEDAELERRLREEMGWTDAVTEWKARK